MKKVGKSSIVVHKYFLNFVSTVSTFGWKILIVENVVNQYFIENWLSEVMYKDFDESHYFRMTLYSIFYSYSETRTISHTEVEQEVALCGQANARESP